VPCNFGDVHKDRGDRTSVNLAAGNGYLVDFRKLIYAPVMTARGRSFLQSLSDRERQILVMVCAGHSNVRIAARLMTSEQVIKNNMRGILAKAGRRNRFELIVFCFGSGTVECPCSHRSRVQSSVEVMPSLDVSLARR
jgi:DNA-binding CsgD family transcriptional regulator